MTTTKYDKKHLTTTQRMKIEDGLNKGLSMAAIGRLIEKDPTTVSKEVKKYRTFQPRDKDQLPLKCARFKELKRPQKVRQYFREKIIQAAFLSIR